MLPQTYSKFLKGESRIPNILKPVLPFTEAFSNLSFIQILAIVIVAA